MSLVERVSERIKHVFDQFSEEASIRNLDASSAMRAFLIDALAEVVRALESDGTATGPEKKAAAMKLLEKFYTVVLEPLDIPFVPDAVVEPFAKALFLKTCDYLVDAFCEWMKSLSVDPTIAAFRGSR